MAPEDFTTALERLAASRSGELGAEGGLLGLPGADRLGTVAALSALCRELPQDPNEALGLLAALIHLATVQIEGKPASLNPSILSILELQIDHLRRSVRACLPPLELKPSRQVAPNPRAREFFEASLKQEQEKIAQQQARQEELLQGLKTLLAKVCESKNLPAENVEFSGFILQDLAIKLSKKKSIGVKELVEILVSSESALSRPPFSLRKPDFNHLFATDEALAADIQRLLKEEPGPSLPFRRIQTARAAYSTMDASQIWERTLPTEAATSALSAARKAAPDNLELVAMAANALSRTFLEPEFKLAPVVEAENAIAKLQKIALTPPTNPETFYLVQSALAKLELMHLLVVVRSETDFDKNKAIGQYIDACCAHITHRYPQGLVANPPTTEDGTIVKSLAHSDWHAFLDRVEVDKEGKPLESIIEKAVVDRLQSLQRIFDTSRARFYSRYEDAYEDDGSFNLEKFNAWALRMIGIVLSYFGDDVDIERLVATVQSGAANEHSTGKHIGFHLTITLKFAIYENGLSVPRGTPKTAIKPVEWQFLAYNSQEDERADHLTYKRSKRRGLHDELGTSLSFSNFAIDLMNVLEMDNCDLGLESSEKTSDIDPAFARFFDRKKAIGDIDIFPDKVRVEELLSNNHVPINSRHERMALLLLEILTKTESSRLVNESVVREIFMNHRLQLRLVVAKCLEWQKTYPHSKFASIIQHKASIVQNMLDARDSERGGMPAVPAAASPDIDTKIVQVKGKGGVTKKKVNPLRLKTTFRGIKTLEATREYHGPVQQFERPQADGSRYFYDQYYDTNGELKEKLTYVIKMVASSYTCYLVGENDPDNLLPIWYVETNPSTDLGTATYHIKEFSYVRMIDYETGATEIVATPDTAQPGKTVSLIRANDIEQLTPLKGMDLGNARVYNLMDAFNQRRVQAGRALKKAPGGARCSSPSRP